MGVEPTKDRLTAPPGFEVRTPHRGRFPSTVCGWRLLVRWASKCLEPTIVDAAQIAAPQCYAMPIEKFEYLDGDLAAVIESIPECRGGELPIRRFGGDVPRDLYHLGYCAAKKKVIGSHFIDFAHTTEQLAEPAHGTFGPSDRPADVTYPGRAKTLATIEQRSHRTP